MESREQQTSGDIPPPIAWHAGQIWDKNMFIVGGVSLQTSETISTDDLFVLDLETLWFQKSHQHSVAADTTIVLTREMPARGRDEVRKGEVNRKRNEEEKEVVVQPTLSILLSDRTQDKARLKKYWPEWVWETEYQETKKHDTRTQSTLHSFLTLPTLTVKVECEYV
ncbi:hypothetical protein BLNAU_5508 [Blattamonas nauphoetae]|uniref:Uncharacterized protein n=1 Tax=Blattamonas nauphoetae TaxID=2049346 RepID=A0ABQ9Y706_9EUKA|nr:hypothetical protein BLNAU_5508 [Blattamonas nauphoetae]